MTLRARRTGLLLLLLLASGALSGAALTPTIAQAASVDQATAYQLDPAHDGYQAGGGTITTPLSQAWSDTLSGNVSYPLVVNGVIYVATANGTLYAIEQATGATLWSHTFSSSGEAGLTYDAGQVFTVSSSGTMAAFDAQTGATDWSVSLPGQSMFTSAPTAYDGVVYVGGAGGGGTVYAVSEISGTVLWTGSVENGDDSSPAVDANGVYVTYACGQDYDFAPLSGALIWHHTSGCEGGGGATPVLANGTIFGRDSSDGDLILSAAGGSQLGTFSSNTVPAVGGGSAYMLAGGTLTVVADSGQGANGWSYSGISGDGTLTTAPLLTGGLLIEGSTTGELYALDPLSGNVGWSGSIGASISAGAALGAGENTIVVPAGQSLVAYTGANLGSGTPADTTAPSVPGKPEIGQAAGADVGVWTALPTSYSYQWYLCNASGASCQQINGATSEAYVVPAADLGDTLKVAVGASNGSGTATAVMSLASAQIIVAAPTEVSPPAISGTTQVGQQLTASSGAWTGSPTSFTYQWLACSSAYSCGAIPGATNSSYTLTSAQAGQMLEVEVTASNSTGSSAAAASGLTAAVSTPISTPGLTLTSSADPAAIGSAVVFTAMLSAPVDGGQLAFYANGTVMPGCAGITMSLDYIGATCTVSSLGVGTWSVTAQYTGDSAYASVSASLTETVVGASSSASSKGTTAGTSGGSASQESAPPAVHVGKSGPKGKPSFKLTLVAVRTGAAATYQYWFAASDVRCMNRASAVFVTAAGHRVQDKCSAGLQLASKSLTGRQSYTLTLQAVRLSRKGKILARGRADRVNLFMPGTEVEWSPLAGATLPTGHSARLRRGS
jgi:outer membrane protein assembly factor BamB